ncbi:basigin isoform X1 [Candoia aspera]|uniref:basigin isoform X1 n=1 Tax=Candoia aspera TaxID=51853 RepID=UPI002FD8167E
MVNSGILALVRYWLPPRWLAPFVLLKGECLGQTERVRLEWRGRVRSARGTDGGAVMAARLLMLMLGSLLCAIGGASAAAGFIKSPLSQKKLTEESVELHCEAVGSPIPEIQWWFEGAGPNDTATQLWDGAWQDRVKISATYQQLSSSTVCITNLTTEDSGTYECRASNDPDRNHLSKSPKVKWIRSQANVIVTEQPKISTSPEVTAGSDVVISCNLTEAPTAIKGHYWMKGETKLDSNDTALDFTSYMIPKVDHQTSGEYHCIFETVPIAKGTVYVKVPPHVVAHKKTEHGGEGDAIMLACKCSSYPTVTQWTWYKVTDEGFQPIVNGTEDRFYITSNKTRTDLWILSLNLEKDPGNYVCNATNQLGDGSAVVDLRVRSRLAALWPFLGIVAEVLVLVTIIFIYEKRRKPNEIPDDDDGGSAPLKGNTANNKDKNVRQRNAN